MYNLTVVVGSLRKDQRKDPVQDLEASLGMVATSSIHLVRARRAPLVVPYISVVIYPPYPDHKIYIYNICIVPNSVNII